MGTLDTGLQVQAQIPGFLPNLFEVSLFGESSTSPGTDDSYFSEEYTGDNQPTKFYCTAYNLPPHRSL